MAAITHTKPTDLRALLTSDAMKKQYALALPKLLSPERFLRVLLTTLNNTPKLAECDQHSVLAGIMTAAQLGLEIDPALGRAYLLPYKGKAQLIIGYRGYIDLAYRSGQLSSISAEVVYEKDEFEFELGLEPRLRHVPCEDEERGALRYAYAVAVLSNGGKVWRVLNRGDVMRAKKSSQSAASEYSPWRTHEAAMWSKTAIRALSKYLPLSPELRDAVAADEHDDRATAAAFSAAVDVTAGATVTEPTSEKPADSAPAGDAKMTPIQRLNAMVVQAAQDGVDPAEIEEALAKAGGKGKTTSQFTPEECEKAAANLSMAIRVAMEGGTP